MARYRFLLLGLVSAACAGSTQGAFVGPQAEQPRVDSILDSELAAELRLQADSSADAAALEQISSMHSPGVDEAPASAPAGKGDVTWDIDVSTFGTHDRVQYWLNFFQGPARERFGIWLERMPLYEDMIRERLQARGLPTDLVYLALIESGFSNSAVSRARAVGMWQFMAPTARYYGLRVDNLVDERRDPFKATEAASRFLADLNRQFGSHYLAAAAYNGGGGRVSRSLGRLYANQEEVAWNDSTFFRLHDTDLLHRETRDYVPKLIAAALIAKEPERYGFQRHPSAPLVYDSLVVTGAVGLDVIARLADTTPAAVRDLNRQYLRLVTPSTGSWVIRLPPGRGEQTARAYAELPASRRVSTQSHLVKRGEVLGLIARRYGVSVADIERANPRLRSRGLRYGERITIPLGSGAAALLATQDEGPGAAPSRRAAPAKTHTVRRGETVSGIARRYGVSQAKLRAWNGLDSRGRIKAGQRLVVGEPAGIGGAPAAKRGTTRTHKVAAGDTLSELSERYGVSVAALKRANKLRGDAIRVGMKLKIPA